MDRQTIRSAFDAAISACEPARAVARVVRPTSHGLSIAGTDMGAVLGDVVVVGLGKAAPAMARGLASTGIRVTGIVVSDHAEDCPLDVVVSDHPIPGPRSLAAGRLVVEMVGRTRPEDLVCFLVSGGGSALVEVPVDGVDMADVTLANEIMVRRGVDIEGMNEIRAAISTVKAGGLAAATRAERLATIVVSDVPSGSLRHVASGPSLPSHLGSGAAAAMDRNDLGDLLPSSVVSAVLAHRTPARRHDGVVVEVASPTLAAEAAMSELRRRGYEVDTHLPVLRGDTIGTLRALIAGGGDGGVVVGAGETTLRVDGPGSGGRNQHAALAASIMIAGSGMMFGAFGTDGVDGATAAAGAIVDGDSAARMRAGGVDPVAALGRFDSHAALGVSGDLVVTGPTGTNVADLWILARA
jgi:glycerate 2-kinase